VIARTGRAAAPWGGGPVTPAAARRATRSRAAG
jgi:hypothetical protein